MALGARARFLRARRHCLFHFTDQAYPLLRVDIVLLFDLEDLLLQLVIDRLNDLAELLQFGDGDLLLA